MLWKITGRNSRAFGKYRSHLRFIFLKLTAKSARTGHGAEKSFRAHSDIQARNRSVAVEKKNALDNDLIHEITCGCVVERREAGLWIVNPVFKRATKVVGGEKIDTPCVWIYGCGMP